LQRALVRVVKGWTIRNNETLEAALAMI